MLISTSTVKADYKTNTAIKLLCEVAEHAISSYKKNEDFGPFSHAICQITEQLVSLVAHEVRKVSLPNTYLPTVRIYLDAPFVTKLSALVTPSKVFKTYFNTYLSAITYNYSDDIDCFTALSRRAIRHNNKAVVKTFVVIAVHLF